MSEISEFEVRITAALERIGRAVAVAEDRAENGGGAGADAGAGIAELTAELEAERDANAQMESRVKAIQDKQETHVATLEQEVESLRNQLIDHDRAMQKLRLVNAQLRDNNAALRAANAEGLGDATLIDEGMRSELEALKMSREADVTELDAILSELRSVVVSTPAAPTTSEEV